MDFSEKRVTEIPLKELWNQKGLISAIRKGYLSEDGIKNILRKNPVKFIIANIGDPLEHIQPDKCYEFWKTEIQSHLVKDPDRSIQLENYPGEYAYLASEWSKQSGQQMILLEKLH
jgi:hypothetical protein